MAGVDLTLTIGDIALTDDDWNALHLYRATSRFGSYALVATIAFVTSQSVYPYNDSTATGTGQYWYRTALYNTLTLTEGPQGDPFPSDTAPVITRQDLRRRAARELNLYGLPPREFTFPCPSGTTTAAGTATTVICDQYRSTEYNAQHYAGHTLLAVGGTNNGQERQITSLTADGTTGTFAMADGFSGALGSGVAFELYELLTASEWNQMINQAALEFWQYVRTPLGDVSGQTEYTLPYYIESPEQIKNINVRTGTGRAHRLTDGYLADLEEIPGGGVSVYLGSGLGSTRMLEIEGYRHPAPMNADTDALILSEKQQELFVLTIATRGAEQIARSAGGASEDRATWQDRFNRINAKRASLARRIGLGKVTTPVRRAPFVTVSGWGRW